MEHAGEKKRVCVTGAGGFLASWVVKFLLEKDYVVHGTVRDPNDEKNAHLRKLEKASENLKLFKVDLLDYDSVRAASAGCEGVLHVASPVPAGKVANPEVELFAPAKEGTLNVLKACTEAKVKRVVVVSSVAAVSMNPNWPKDKVKNEECWSDKEYCRETENWYCLSKILAESEAFDYASKHGLDLVTICPGMVLGPLLQSTLNASSSFLVSILTGKRESMENSDWHFVDVRDVAEAIILAYEKPEASGRYICIVDPPIKFSDFIDMVKEMYPNYDYPKKYTEAEKRPPMTAEKLRKLGWKCRPLKETVIDSVERYKEVGLVKKE